MNNPKAYILGTRNRAVPQLYVKSIHKTYLEAFNCLAGNNFSEEIWEVPANLDSTENHSTLETGNVECYIISNGTKMFGVSEEASNRHQIPKTLSNNISNETPQVEFEVVSSPESWENWKFKPAKVLQIVARNTNLSS